MSTLRPSDWFPTSKIGTDSSPVVFMLRDARGTGARGVIARGDDFLFRFLTTHHTSCSRAAHVAQHEDDWRRVRDRQHSKLSMK